MERNFDYKKLVFRGGNKVKYDFSDFKTFDNLIRDLYFKEMIIDDAEIK